MLDQNFYSFLEYHLSKSFKYSQNESIKQFWCDGIIPPINENEYSQKAVNDNRQVVLTAYLGKDGQDKYSMLIRFGKKSLSRYARGLDIKECIPNFERDDWYIVDEEDKHIIIQLH